jgi:hypothetical protein
MMTRDREYAPGQAREYIIEIAVGRLLPLLLLVAAVVLSFGSSARAGPDETQALAPVTYPLGIRGWYYLTDGIASAVQGDGVLTACAKGYHVASIWEIADPTNLIYDTTLGFTLPTDVGQGPPTNFYGWVRTGAASYTGNSPGRSNCGVWTSSSGSYYGTRAGLPQDWTAATHIGPWQVDTSQCTMYNMTWCYRPPFTAFLPLILKSY